MSLRLFIWITEWIRRAAMLIIAACAVYYFVVFVYITLSRIHYPFSLEWVEGASLIQVQRLLMGENLYSQPNFEYIALPYPPLYFYVSALFARGLGFGFFPLRLVSLISSLGSMAMIYLICRRESTRIIPALAAGGLFAATFQLSGFWFDIGRIDMLAAFLVLFSIFLLRLKSPASSAIAGLIFALACLTKQTNLFSLILICLYCVIFDWRTSFTFVISSILSFGITSLLFNRAFSGWYKYFVFNLPFGSGVAPSITLSMVIKAVPDFWLNTIILLLPVASLFGIVYVIANLKNGKNSSRGIFYIFCSVGLIGTSWASIAHLGGYKNDLIPALSIISILFGLGFQWLGYGRGHVVLKKILIPAACILQFVLLYYPMAPQIPTSRDLLAGQALISQIYGQSGDVFVPFHPELALMAGKRTFASWSAMGQLGGEYGGGDPHATQRVKMEFSYAMKKQEFSMILLDKDLNFVWGHPEKYYYMGSQLAFSDPRVFWPVTGWAVRPTMEMFPRQK